MNKSAQELASIWIEKWSHPDPVTGVDDCDLDSYIFREKYPNLCLEAILEILEVIPADTANHHFQLLAAGPLEDLLVEHGETFVERIEKLARQRPNFRLLLNGVWDSGIKPEIVKQLSKYWVNKW